MNKAFIEKIKKIGKEETYSADQFLVLDDSEKIHFVLQGRITLFLVKLVDRETQGHRISIGSVKKKEWMFGADLSHLDEQWHLIAVPDEKSVVYECPTDTLFEKGCAESFFEDITNLSEKWVDLLGFKSRRYKELRDFKLLIASDENVTIDKPIKTSEGILWVQPQDHALKLFGQDEFLVKPDSEHFPISTHIWLQIEEETEVEIRETKDLLEQEKLSSCLMRYTQMTLHAILFLEPIYERRALSKRLQQDQDTIEGAFRSLEDILKVSRKIMPPGAGSINNLQRAVYSIMQYLNIKVDIDQLFVDYSDTEDRKVIGSAVFSITRMARVRAREVALKSAWWKDDNGPILAFLEETNEPIALIPVNANSYDLFNPKNNSRVRVTEEVADKIKPFGYYFYRPFANIKLKAKKLIKFSLQGLKRDLIIIFSMSILTGLLGLIVPVITGQIFDNVVPSADISQLLQFVLAMLAVAFATSMFTLARNFGLLRLQGRMDSSLQASVWDRLLKLPVPFFRKYTAGDLAMRANAISSIRQTLSGAVFNSIFSSIFALFSFILLFYYSMILAFIVLGIVVLFGLTIFFMSYWKSKYERKLVDISQNVSSTTLQIFYGIAKLRTCGAEGRTFSLWSKLFTKKRRIVFKAETIGNIVQTINVVFPIISMMLIFASVSYILKTGALTTGEYLAFNAAYGTVLGGIIELSDTAITILNIMPLYDSVRPIVESLPEVDKVKADPGELSGKIDIVDVSFSYTKDGPLILKNINLSIGAGEYVAIVGPSGCGKSTLIRLLLGFEKPNLGAIYYDDKDLENLDTTLVRNQFGVVLQNSQLLSGDIFTNIVGSSSLTMDDAWEAAEMAGFADDIRAMPMEMHTMIGAFGGGLSGGQQQRLSICRAIVHKPKILIFDEATSALDNLTQQHVSNSLDRLNTTRIVVAHRLTTIVNADRIVVLEKGRIVQMGTFDELMEQEGLLKDLAQRQMA